ncbi:HEAT repeat domain-containing protein [Glycocaulis sp.]|uniref:HEAT repeat domain-containing protein n=1 Tax=Glycocaulis sp. TaxID=1969725 RepID=UPI003D226446
MLAIIAALSLMQAGEDMITRDELAAIADCASPVECLELTESSRRELVNPPAWHLTARVALRHFGMDAITEMEAWAGEDRSRRQIIRSILYRWPNTDLTELERVAELLSTDTVPHLPTLPPADMPDALLPYLERLSADALARRFGYAERERLLMSYVPRSEPSQGTRAYTMSYEGRRPLQGNPYRLEDAYLLADDWTRIAQNPDEPIERRIAALHGIRHLGPDAYAFIHRIRTLEAGDLGELSLAARRAALDPAVAADLARECASLGERLATTRPRHEAEPGDELMHALDMEASFEECLTDLADFGTDARAAAPLIRRFAETDNLRLQIPAIQTLGAIGDEASRPMLRRRLQDAEWQSVYAAALALRHIAEQSDREALRDLAARHWLPAVREAALMAARSTRVEHQGTVNLAIDVIYAHARTEPLDGDAARIWYPEIWFATELGMPVIRTASECRSDAFRFQNVVVQGSEAMPLLPSAYNGAPELPFAGGMLEDSNRGDWGGQLNWREDDTPAQKVLIRDNIVGVAITDANTLIVATGRAHMASVTGTLYRVDWRGDDDWTVTRISTLPSTPRWLARLDDERFAVATAHGLIVFDRERVIGLGHCEPGPPTARN